MKYKIAHIARPVAGIGVYVKLIIKHLNDSKFENHLIYNKADQTFEIRDKSNREISKKHVNIIREINPFIDFLALINIIKQLKTIKPDLIHCHSAKAGILGRIAGLYLGIPTVYTPNAFSYLSANSWAKRVLYQAIEKILSSFSSKLLACSPSEKDRALDDLKINMRKILLWNNSIPDIALIANPSALEEIPRDYICAIGRPSYQKNIDLLIEVLSKLKEKKPDIHLVLLGVGHYSPEIKKVNALILEYKLSKNITIIPWLERDDTMAILKQASVYVSTARYEGLPYALIEAMCLSKPCVVTEVDGNKDLVQDHINGFLCSQEDPNQMAEKIITLLNDEKIYQQYSNSSRQIWEANYNILNTISDLETLYSNEIHQKIS